MTGKKRIIINGINVSKCKLLCNHYCYLHMENEFLCHCEDYPDCDYKQLAHKTQEYNKLLKQYKELDDRVNRMIEEKYNLATECEYYRNTLEEIEEIVKGMRSVFIEETSITASQLNDRIYRESTTRFQQILNIINELEESK